MVGSCACSISAISIFATGLNQGLQSLVDGGIPPRLLIIDDGWQSTDVDASLRQTTSQKLRLTQSMPELDETEGEFIEAELEMLQMSARNIPAGTALGERLSFWYSFAVCIPWLQSQPWFAPVNILVSTSKALSQYSVTVPRCPAGVAKCHKM